MRPIVDIYSTFLQRSYDQIFQEVALQNLPVMFMLDRAGLTGPDGPTHHGVLRHRLHAAVPEHGRAWPPATSRTWRRCSTSRSSTTARSSIRYPKANLETVERARRADRAGQGRGASSGATTACFVACGTLLPTLREGGREAARRRACDVGVINARFVKPLDRETILQAVETLPLVVTVEEGTLEGGFGSAVLEAANAAGLDTRNVVRLGMPDRFVEHGERDELLADLGLSADALVSTGSREPHRRSREVRVIGSSWRAATASERAGKMHSPRIARSTAVAAR